jgi:uridine kinase
MKGDIVIVQAHHQKVALVIVPMIINNIRGKNRIYTLTIGGESGCGKSEISLAIANELSKNGIKAIILGQDDYFFLPPKLNSEKRRENSDWLGPDIEVNLDLLENNLIEAIQGKSEIIKPLIDYNKNTIEMEVVNLKGIKVIIAEGTYTSLLKNIDIKIFITRNWHLTLEDRNKRSRGNEVHDPFTENILAIEHKIIAGHKHLADLIVNDDYEVINVGSEIVI